MENYVLILNGNGDNGSQVIVDSSYNPKTITAYGNAQNSTNAYTEGTASLKFDGNGDYISIPDSSDFYFDENDFTIDFHINFTSKPGYCILLALSESSNRGLFIDFINNGSKTGINFAYIYDSAEFRIGEGTNASNDYATNTWYHIKIVRKNNIIYIFKNGDLSNYAECSYTILNNLNSSAIIGGYNPTGTSYYFNGYLDEFKISNGNIESRYEIYNSIIDLAKVDQKTYNSIISIWDTITGSIDKRYNSEISIITVNQKRYNSIINLENISNDPLIQRYNSVINLSNNIFISIPVTYNAKERLSIGGSVNILPFSNFDNLPFSIGNADIVNKKYNSIITLQGGV